ncbi:MAG: class I SAM-dependent methyltransferase [Candidatus Omnitrophica bacterium]|nr:class I SAM-dependent methyltransferase [Candidatus Omnitrophota bacterium]
MNIKKEIYSFIVQKGLKCLSLFFPDIHMSIPLKPSDRFLEYPFVFKYLPNNKNIKLLDIGCAGSFFPLVVAALGYNVTACDIRPYEILNSIKFDNFEFRQQDICKNPLGEETFDIITCISVLEHIGLGGRYGVVKDEFGDLKMVEQIKKVVKSNGKVLITVPYGVSEIYAPYHRVYDLERVRKLEDGFRVIQEKFYCQNEDRDWRECSAQEGQLKKGGLDRYGLALLYLEKI